VPDCKKLLTQMSDYIDGQLAPEICESLKRHLAECPNCQVMYDSLTHTIRIFREGKEEPLPEGLKSNLQKALQTRWAGRKRN
jgi:anti-sigma factor (TIGR02949 family)